MNPAQLKALRDEVMRRHRAATRKVSRLRQQGVELGGTTEDPRRSLARIRRYNAPQLQAQLDRLNAFTARSNSYVGLARGTAPGREWQRYKRNERRYNAVGKAHLASIADVFVPQRGMTIGQFEDQMRPVSVRAQNEVVIRPYVQMDRKAHNITTPEALEKINADMERRLASDYLPKRIKAQRLEMLDLLDAVGADELKADVLSLTDKQFDVIWNYNPVATNLSAVYHTMQNQNRGVYMASDEKIIEDNLGDARELIEWAKTIT